MEEEFIDIGKGALWDAVLSAEEILQIYEGAHPLCIRPKNLIAYWPLLSDDEEKDIIDAYRKDE